MIELILQPMATEREQAYEKLIQIYKPLLAQVQAGEDCYADNLGWLETERWAGRERLAQLKALAEHIREEAEVFVLIGVGGSNNAARAALEALSSRFTGKPEIVYAGNTLSPHTLLDMLKQLEGKSVYLDCIAKNFETLEPGASFRILRAWMDEQYGGEAARHIVATGTRGSALDSFCKAHGYTFLEFPDDIGGRYSALSSVGLLPMAVAGIDIEEMVKGAEKMELLLRTASARNNPAYIYACFRQLCYEEHYSMELLSSFEPRMRGFFKWWIQLFAESQGKDGKGIFPLACEFSEELHAVGQFIQEGTPLMFETFLDVKTQQDSLLIQPDGREDGFGYLDGKDFWDLNRAACEATLQAHNERIPCQRICVERMDAGHLGALFYFFEFACYLSCRMMGVNPFNQEGVEAYKRRMFAALGK